MPLSAERLAEIREKVKDGDFDVAEALRDLLEAYDDVVVVRDAFITDLGLIEEQRDIFRNRMHAAEARIVSLEAANKLLVESEESRDETWRGLLATVEAQHDRLREALVEARKYIGWHLQAPHRNWNVEGAEKVQLLGHEALAEEQS